MRTLGQLRAEYCIEALAGLNDSLRADFKPFSSGLPAMILQNGFGQALAFLLAKGKEKQTDKHLTAFQIITGWLEARTLITHDSRPNILKQISTMEQSEYLQCQRETLAMLEWLKRYANASLFEG